MHFMRYQVIIISTPGRWWLKLLTSITSITTTSTDQELILLMSYWKQYCTVFRAKYAYTSTGTDSNRKSRHYSEKMLSGHHMSRSTEMFHWCHLRELQPLHFKKVFGPLQFNDFSPLRISSSLHIEGLKESRNSLWERFTSKKSILSWPLWVVYMQTWTIIYVGFFSPHY